MRVVPVMRLVSMRPVIPLVSMIFLMLLVRVVCKDGSCTTKPADPHQDQEPCDVSSHGCVPFKEVNTILVYIILNAIILFHHKSYSYGLYHIYAGSSAPARVLGQRHHAGSPWACVRGTD
jgi:hypothetical protein